jgi:hypothetical protein
VILLDDIVQVFTRPDLRLRAQHSTLLESCHSRVCGRIAVESDLVGSTVPLYCSCEESLSGSDISMLAQQEINCQAMPIDGAIEVCPAPFDSDVRFVHAPSGADGSRVGAPSLLELRDIALDPPEDCCMRDRDSSLGHHLDEVAVAQLVGDIPSDAENDYCATKVAAAE